MGVLFDRLTPQSAVFPTERCMEDVLTDLRQGLTPDRLRAYIAELAETVASITLSGRITNLAEALRVMTQGTSHPYLNLARQRLKVRA